jgi:lipoprotein-anchoring transpeptidase ErfK/SrfK
LAHVLVGEPVTTSPGHAQGMEGFMRAIMRRRCAAVAFAALAFSAAPASGREIVNFNAGYAAGTIVVRTAERRLYLVLGNGQAIRYPVGVGRAGKQWAGVSRIDGKYLNPAWSPPAEVKRDKPSLPDVIPGGSPRNPMGIAAMTLAGGEYAIHGTNQPGSVGGFVSYGCIRMYNQDISDLFGRVSVGTAVVVTR